MKRRDFLGGSFAALMSHAIWVDLGMAQESTPDEVTFTDVFSLVGIDSGYYSYAEQTDDSSNELAWFDAWQIDAILESKTGLVHSAFIAAYEDLYRIRYRMTLEEVRAIAIDEISGTDYVWASAGILRLIDDRDTSSRFSLITVAIGAETLTLASYDRSSPFRDLKDVIVDIVDRDPDPGPDLLPMLADLPEGMSLVIDTRPAQFTDPAS